MYTLVTAPEQLPDALRQLKAEVAAEPVLALDVETYANGNTSPKDGYKFWDPYTNSVRVVQLKSRHGAPVIFDIQALGLENCEALIGFLNRPDITWVGHNLKFDFKMLAVNLGVHLKQIYCTFIAAFVLGYATGMSARAAAGIGLKDLVRDFLGIRDMDKTQQKSYWGGVLSELQLQYAADDVQHVIPLYDVFTGMFRDEYQCTDAVQLEMDCLPAVCRIELNGILLDLEMYKLVQRCARAALPKLKKQICDHFGLMMQRVYNPQTKTFGFEPAGINLDSNPQMKALFNRNGIMVEDLEAETLEGFAATYPIVQVYLDYKGLVKQLGVDYERFIHPVTGRIHPTFNQNGAATGRFGCEKPNLQQVPKLDILVPEFILEELKANGLYDRLQQYWMEDRGTLVLNYRYCFIARPGYKMLSADYSGQEVGVVVGLSKDPFMLEVMRQPKELPAKDDAGQIILGPDGKPKMVKNLAADLHSQVAAKMFKVPIERVKDKPPQYGGKSYRDLAKAIVFGLCYGKSHVSLAAEWGITEQEAKKIINEFFQPMPVLRRWLDRQGELGMKTRLCRFALGRLRFLNDSKHTDKNAADRAARNTPIQGTSALMMKKALILVDQLALLYPDMIIPIGSVHDEALAELLEAELKDLLDLCEMAMKRAADFFLNGLVPIDVGMGVGPTWTK